MNLTTEETFLTIAIKFQMPEYDDHVGGGGMDNMPVNRAVGVGVGGGYYQR